jgi:glucose/arabinose dehydrogenase
MTLLLDVPHRAPRGPRTRAIPRARLFLLVLTLLGTTVCWWARGRGYVHAIKRRIYPAAVVAQPPRVVVAEPPDGATDVAVDVIVAADIASTAGLEPASITATSALLIRTSDQTVVPTSASLSQPNQLALRPARPLEPGTNYTFCVTAGLEDKAGRHVAPYAIAFSTAAAADPVIRFEQAPQATSRDVGFTCLQVGPDGRLYAGSDDGRILRFPIAPDGTLGSPQVIESLQRSEGGPRLLTGFCFDPTSTADKPIIWASHGFYAFANAPDWSGKISRISGSNLEHVRDVVINLPRSARDHATNQPSFGPDGALYIPQGSNTAFGGADPDWSNRPERLLSASILRLDVRRVTSDLPLDARTPDGDGRYDPYLPDAPLSIHAAGVRLAYDMVWADDGQLYVPTNGSAAGGNAPGPLPLLRIPLSEDDWLFRIVPGKYFGHPNPQQGHFILNGGNPTSGYDFAETPLYAVGTSPDPDWVPAVHSFGKHASANGIIQYKADIFGGALQGTLLVCRYNVPGDLAVLHINDDGRITPATTRVAGFTDLANPLDVCEHPQTGSLYVSEYGARRITLLRPVAALNGG